MKHRSDQIAYNSLIKDQMLLIMVSIDGFKHLRLAITFMCMTDVSVIGYKAQHHQKYTTFLQNYIYNWLQFPVQPK